MFKKILKRCAVIFTFSCFLIPAAQAARGVPIPQALQPWQAWVLQGQEESQCPFLQNQNSQHECAWASPLNLQLGDHGGDFSQNWELHQPAWVALPGNQKHWPQNVRVNGEAKAVLKQGGQPQLFLKAGTYRVQGSFQWKQLPEAFSVPTKTGVLKLTVNGALVPFPQWNLQSGQLWLQKSKVTVGSENVLELRVHRKITDEIPLRLTTVLLFDVSGESRELVLPKVLPNRFVAMNIQSSLPTRLDDSGNLKVQIKPGAWRVELNARYQGPFKEVKLAKKLKPWPEEEIWAFEPRNELRLVEVQGVTAIDPQQTTIDGAWKQFPTYRLQAGTAFRLVEKRRGDSNPAPDQLSLHREWWLDFNGSGFTVHDQIRGTLHQNWRLEMNPPYALGRIAVSGQDQFITQLPDNERLGVEVRQSTVNVTADSRIRERGSFLPAVGWNNDFQRVSGMLNLPPGWRLFAARGVDEAATWINGWTLLDIFLVLITTLAIFNLWGWKWGAIALLTFILTFPEAEAPRWIWLALIVAYALLRVIPVGKLTAVLKLYKLGALLLLVGFSMVFMVNQLRVGLYPSLEYPWKSVASNQSARQVSFRTTAPAPRMEEVSELEADMAAPPPAPAESLVRGKVMGKAKGVRQMLDSSQSSYARYGIKAQQNLQSQRPGTKVQTGPGLPRWRWNAVRLDWHGPVAKDQQIKFWLLSPPLNLLLVVLRVVFLAALLLLFATGWRRPRALAKPAGKAALMLALAVGLGATTLWSQPAHAEFPPESLLNELQERLLEDPLCHPECAQISRMTLAADGNRLQLRIEAHAQADVAIPLPGEIPEWQLETILLDGRPATLVRSDDKKVWLNLSPGVHQIAMTGVLPAKATVQISLPLKPHQVETQLNGWTLSGLHEDGGVESTLQLTRVAGLTATQSGSKENWKNRFPTFVRVERNLLLGLTWEARTQVKRVTATGEPVVLEVPLLPGEAVTSSGVRVKDRKVLINMGPNENSVSWRSVLKEQSQLTLKAPHRVSDMEVWSVEANPIWNVNYSGIPVIQVADTTGTWHPQWRPWPGESVTLKVMRPTGVPGQTMTIDHSKVIITPGLRYTQVKATLQLRSSLGAQHVMSLPEAAELQSVKIDGREQPIRLDSGQLTLPVVPGKQKIELTWQEETGIKSFYRAPTIDWGMPSVNSEMSFHLSEDRWVLGTPWVQVGPAVQFWILLIVILLFSFALSRWGIAPLRVWEWFLLGIGISQFPENPVMATLFVAGWLIALGWRGAKAQENNFIFNLRQLALAGYTLVAIIIICMAIYEGLLGNPDMQIAGNASSHQWLHWFYDRVEGTLPRPWVFSVPLFVYRIAMLAWALWLAFALLRWIKWAWQCFSSDGLWRPMNVVKKG